MTILTGAQALPLEDASMAWAEALYRLYGARVYRFMYYRLGQREAAEDLTGAVFQKVIENRQRFDPDKGDEAVWLFTIARRTLTDHLRRRRPTAPLDALADLPSPAVSPETAAEAAGELARLGEALKALSERELSIVSLKYAGGLKNTEIARVQGLSEKNVGVILTRSRQKLRLLLTEEESR